jgi:hypothetical protein
VAIADIEKAKVNYDVARSPRRRQAGVAVHRRNGFYLASKGKNKTLAQSSSRASSPPPSSSPACTRSIRDARR